MEYLLFAFVCKFIVELVFKLAKKIYKHFKAKEKSATDQVADR